MIKKYYSILCIVGFSLLFAIGGSFIFANSVNSDKGFFLDFFANLSGKCSSNQVLQYIDNMTGNKHCAKADILVNKDAVFGLCPTGSNTDPVITSLQANKVNSSKVKLSWTSENTTGCYVHGFALNISANGANDSKEVSVSSNSNTTSTIECGNASGTTTAQITYNLSLLDSFNSSSAGFLGNNAPPVNFPNINPSGELSGGLFGSYIYSIGQHCNNTDQVIVGFSGDYIPRCVSAISLMPSATCPGIQQPFALLKSSKNSITQGESIKLSWNSHGMSSCNLTGQSIGSVLNGTTGDIYPNTTTDYTLSCSNNDTGQKITKVERIIVNNPPVNGGWSSFGSCQSNCTKTRTCTNPSPQYGGSSCIGDQSAPCNGGACVGYCGNGYIDSGEKCDGNTNMVDCSSDCKSGTLKFDVVFQYIDMQDGNLNAVNSNVYLTSNMVTNNPFRRIPSTKDSSTHINNTGYIKMYMVDRNGVLVDPTTTMSSCIIHISGYIFAYSSYNEAFYIVSPPYLSTGDITSFLLSWPSDSEISLFHLRDGYDLGYPLKKNGNLFNNFKFAFPDYNTKYDVRIQCRNAQGIGKEITFSLHSSKSKAHNTYDLLPLN